MLVLENCDSVLTEEWIPLYRFDHVTLGGYHLLLVGDDKLGGWILLLVGARKSWSWSFLPVGAGKHVECNIYIINNIFCGFLPFGFPH